MENPTKQELIRFMKGRIFDLERLNDLQLSRGANVGRNDMMDGHARSLIDEASELLAMIRGGDHVGS